MNDSRKDIRLATSLHALAGTPSPLPRSEAEAQPAPEASGALDAAGAAALSPRLEALGGEGLRPGIHAPLEFLPALLGFGEATIPVPNLPEGISEEESLSMSTLSSVLTAYYRTLPESVRDEYVSQVMRFAGEKAGQLIRICSEH